MAAEEAESIGSISSAPVIALIATAPFLFGSDAAAKTTTDRLILMLRFSPLGSEECVQFPCDSSSSGGSSLQERATVGELLPVPQVAAAAVYSTHTARLYFLPRLLSFDDVSALRKFNWVYRSNCCEVVLV